ncbi:MAG: hypothetical protein J6B85_05615 [Lachnospiraceae bacterium]|nr:hypothetical protein [Lachnospiraceae bacterium]
MLLQIPYIYTMMFGEKWIWLSGKEYPNYQTTNYSSLTNQAKDSYAVAEINLRNV